MDEHWSEVRDDDSAFQRACADDDLRDVEFWQRHERLEDVDPRDSASALREAA